jgi:hypothetical protein
MRHTSRKRSLPNPLAPIDARTWLVERDAVNAVIESMELAPGPICVRLLLRLDKLGPRLDGWPMTSGRRAGSFSQGGTASASE